MNERSTESGALTAPLVAVEQEDRHLAGACADGDSLAFERIYREYGSRMKSVAFNMMGTRADAEDVIQETFLKIHRSARSFQGESSFGTWMFRILVNCCHDALRRRASRIRETALEVAEERGSRSDPGVKLLLRTLLDRLGGKQKEVFLLFEVEGFSHKEIAGILGIDDTYSKWLLFDAKRQLKKMLRAEP